MADDLEASGITLSPRGDRSMQWDDRDSWTLYLPHSCDEWVIASDPDRDTVLASARRFRDELDQAIGALEKAR